MSDNKSTSPDGAKKPSDEEKSGQATKPVDTATQEEAAKERKETGGYQ